MPPLDRVIALRVPPEECTKLERGFETVVAAAQRLIPGIALITPGLCTVRARGPARYYGGEVAAAEALLTLTHELGLTGARVGVAAGSFTAEQASLADAVDPGIDAPAPGIRVVADSHTAQFLGQLPVTRAADEALATTLMRLGVRTLGALTALPEASVHERFGLAGLTAHRFASGALPPRASQSRPVSLTPDFDIQLNFEPPLSGADQLAFASSTTADDLVRTLREHGLVCTELTVRLVDDSGGVHERAWAHPTFFSAADVINRVRWQSSESPGSWSVATPNGGVGTGGAGDSVGGSGARGTDGTTGISSRASEENTGAGIARLTLLPSRTEPAAAHQPGLWHTGLDGKIHHQLSRVQGLLGHEAVGVGEVVGGRLSTDRQQFVPWGTSSRFRGAASRAGAAHAPWPGHLGQPVPVTIFPNVRPEVALWAIDGSPVRVDGEDELTAPPASVLVGSRNGGAPGPDAAARDHVVAWSKPWPLRERWWRGVRQRARLQVLSERGEGWLLIYERGRWFAEGRYS